MPYIDVAISKELTVRERETLKTKLGELITVIPGKTESVLMIGIDDGKTMFFSGEKKPLVAFLEIKLFNVASRESKSEFTEKVFEFFEREYGIKPDSLFLTFSEHDSWGFRGSLKFV